MKAACKALLTSIYCSVIFLILTIIFVVLYIYFESNSIVEIVLNIFVGLFGSSFVALLLSIPAYSVAKRQLLEKYFEHARVLIRNISKIKYLNFCFNEKNLIGYIQECNNEKFYSKIKLKRDNKALKEYKKNIMHEYLLSNELDKEDAEKNVKDKIESFRKAVKKICLKYIEVSENVSTSQLSNLYGDMQFFTGKKELEKIYKNLYKPFVDILNEIIYESYHLKLYINDKGNEAVAIEKISKLQNKIYRIEIKEDSEYKWEILYNDFVDTMLIELEKFRANIYNIKPESQNLHPVSFKMIKKK